MKNICYINILKWALGIVFSAGILYAQFSTIRRDIPELKAGLKEHEIKLNAQDKDLATLMERTEYIVRGLERLSGREYNGK